MVNLEAENLIYDSQPDDKNGQILIRVPGRYEEYAYLVRTPTPKERKLIVLNYIRMHGGRKIRIEWFSDVLNVSGRTIQKILKELKDKGKVRVIPTFSENGKQGISKYVYIGGKMTLEEKECNLENLRKEDNPYGFRDFDWDDFRYDSGTSSEYTYDLLQYRRELLSNRRLAFLKSREKKKE